jgi:hypothetical protein
MAERFLHAKSALQKIPVKTHLGNTASGHFGKREGGGDRLRMYLNFGIAQASSSDLHLFEP